MKPVLLVRNSPVETLGHAVRSIGSTGAPVRIWEAADASSPSPDLEDLSGVVMFGGTMNVDEVDEHPFLKENRDITRECVERELPYLGICLGAQLLARAVDTPVIRAPVKEIGFEPVHPNDASTDDRLMSVYGEGDSVFQWHQDTMELPNGATLLATSDHIPVQAFRIGGNAWGLQFHFEIDAEELEMWLDEASSFMDLEEVWGKSARTIRAEAALHMSRHVEQGAEVFSRFAEIAAGRL